MTTPDARRAAALHLHDAFVKTRGEEWLRFQGSSMAPTLREGDLLSVRHVAPGELAFGDIVVFEVAEAQHRASAALRAAAPHVAAHQRRQRVARSTALSRRTAWSARSARCAVARRASTCSAAGGVGCRAPSRWCRCSRRSAFRSAAAVRRRWFLARLASVSSGASCACSAVAGGRSARCCGRCRAVSAMTLRSTLHPGCQRPGPRIGDRPAPAYAGSTSKPRAVTAERYFDAVQSPTTPPNGAPAGRSSGAFGSRDRRCGCASPGRPSWPQRPTRSAISPRPTIANRDEVERRRPHRLPVRQRLDANGVAGVALVAAGAGRPRRRPRSLRRARSWSPSAGGTASSACSTARGGAPVLDPRRRRLPVQRARLAAADAACTAGCGCAACSCCTPAR